MSEVFDKTWISAGRVSAGADLMVAFGIRYIGTAASGIVTVASTGDMAFLHGVAAAEVADTTVNPGGDTPGTLDLVGGTLDLFPTFGSIEKMVNASANWEMWLIGARPEQVAHVTTTGHILAVTGTNGDCGGSGSDNKLTGYEFVFDNSAADLFGVGLTLGGPSTVIHNGDSGVEWRCKRISCLSTDATAASATLKLYACNDQAGTSRVLKTFIPGASTVQVYYPAAATPAIENHGVTLGGERMVLTYVGGGALTGTGVLDYLSIEGEYRIVSPAANKGNMNPELIRS